MQAMILYGRFHSPFVRRIAIWLNLQGRAFQHEPIMVTGEDFDRLKSINPVGRVPALQIDGGPLLIETAAITDWIEDTAPVERRLLPPSGTDRMEAMRTIAYANSLAEKAVALVYDTIRRPEQLHWQDWIARLSGQCRGALDLLEASAPQSGFFGGQNPAGADTAAVASYDFMKRTHPKVLTGPYARLEALSQRANQLPAFASAIPD